VRALKLCKDCRHFRERTQECWHPSNVSPDVVYGKDQARNSIRFLRHYDHSCSAEARWWEPKEGA